MRYVLENDTLRVEIDSFGAELKSVKRKSDGKEYMWYADKNIGEEPPLCCFRLWGTAEIKSTAMAEKRMQ